MKDFYYILGVDENCTVIEIREAYRKLSKKFHPDLNQNDKYFESRFREVNEAYETLIDPERRRRYNEVFKKIRSNTTDAEQNRQQYYRQQARPGSGYTHTPPVASRSKTKVPDIAFTLILFILTLIFGDYVIKSVNSSKAKTVNNAPVASVVPYATVKHHKKKHNLKAKTTGYLPVAKAAKQVARVKLDSSKVRFIQPVVHAVPPAPVTVIQPEPMSSPKPADPTNVLYATYVKSNLTGLINMRESANFGSDVVQTIPSNSKVLVLEKGDTYYKVQFDHATGYVPKWTLETR